MSLREPTCGSSSRVNKCNRDVTSTEPGMPQVQLLTCSQPALNLLTVCAESLFSSVLGCRPLRNSLSEITRSSFCASTTSPLRSRTSLPHCGITMPQYAKRHHISYQIAGQRMRQYPFRRLCCEKRMG